MAIAQRKDAPENVCISTHSGTARPRRFTVSGVRLAPEEIISRGMTLNACSALHDVVHAFRRAHGIADQDVGAGAARYRAAIASYPLKFAPSGLQGTIGILSSAGTYANLRQGGRLLSQYPPLSDESLSKCSEEIRAALVWSTFPGNQ